MPTLQHYLSNRLIVILLAISLFVSVNVTSVNVSAFSTAVSKSIGYGSDNDNQTGTTVAGIGTKNITITDTAKQATTQASALDINRIKITQSSADVLANQGLENRFDKDAVQSEIDMQVAVMQAFDQTRQGIKQIFNEKIDTLKTAVC